MNVGIVEIGIGSSVYLVLRPLWPPCFRFR